MKNLLLILFALGLTSCAYTVKNAANSWPIQVNGIVVSAGECIEFIDVSMGLVPVKFSDKNGNNLVPAGKEYSPNNYHVNYIKIDPVTPAKLNISKEENPCIKTINKNIRKNNSEKNEG